MLASETNIPNIISVGTTVRDSECQVIRHKNNFSISPQLQLLLVGVTPILVVALRQGLTMKTTLVPKYFILLPQFPKCWDQMSQHVPLSAVNIEITCSQMESTFVSSEYLSACQESYPAQHGSQKNIATTGMSYSRKLCIGAKGQHF